MSVCFNCRRVLADGESHTYEQVGMCRINGGAVIAPTASANGTVLQGEGGTAPRAGVVGGVTAN